LVHARPHHLRFVRQAKFLEAAAGDIRGNDDGVAEFVLAFHAANERWRQDGGASSRADAELGTVVKNLALPLTRVQSGVLDQSPGTVRPRRLQTGQSKS